MKNKNDEHNLSITILLVDDEKSILSLLSKILNKDGYKSIQAENGIEALIILEKEQINCILSDIKMPKMDGLTMLKKIREKNNPVPVIFFTSFGEQTLMMKALEYGAYDFIDKPDFKNLEAVLTAGIKNNFGIISSPKEKEASSKIFISEYRKMLKKLN
ncbi:MAG: response regulator [Oligoflexia bacterium]|nr:response regulator [Oligoflexia bacterium]